jgi:hypothetical protein
MRRSYSTITPALVRATAATGLRAALPWRSFGALVSATTLLELVLLTAALRSSYSAVLRRCRFGFSHETARQALDANLPALDRLAGGLVDALHGYLPRVFRRRAWDVAIDLHYVPFYGPARTPGTLGGPKKHGTNRFFVYATAVVVQRGQRWCLGLVPVPATRGDAAIAALLDQLQARGVRVRCLLLDRGFFSGHVILALQARQLPFVVGLVRKGRRINRLFDLPSGQVATHAWKTERGGRPVQVAVVAVRRRVGGRWRREAYAYEGVGPDRAVRRYQRAGYYRRLYQRRFGIETSYRQMNQGKARTTTKDPRQRLLWLGVALLLRQVWVWLQQQLVPRGTNWRHWTPSATLRLANLLEWLADQLQRRHPAPKEIPLPQPVQLPVATPLTA